MPYRPGKLGASNGGVIGSAIVIVTFVIFIDARLSHGSCAPAGLAAIAAPTITVHETAKIQFHRRTENLFTYSPATTVPAATLRAHCFLTAVYIRPSLVIRHTFFAAQI